MEKFIPDLMRIVTDIVNSSRGEKPDWQRLEEKDENLRVLAQTAIKAEKDGSFVVKEG